MGQSGLPSFGIDVAKACRAMVDSEERQLKLKQAGNYVTRGTSLPPRAKTSAMPSSTYCFQAPIWFGCKRCFAAISWIALSPRNASSAAFALNPSVKFRRFAIFVCLHRFGIHLSTLSVFLGPLQPDHSETTRKDQTKDHHNTTLASQKIYHTIKTNR